MLEGNHLRTICDGAIEARFSGTDIIAEKTEEQIADRFGIKRWM
jgi:hypothetical protein